MKMCCHACSLHPQMRLVPPLTHFCSTHSRNLSFFLKTKRFEQPFECNTEQKTVIEIYRGQCTFILCTFQQRNCYIPLISVKAFVNNNDTMVKQFYAAIIQHLEPTLLMSSHLFTFISKSFIESIHLQYSFPKQLGKD